MQMFRLSGIGMQTAPAGTIHATAQGVQSGRTGHSGSRAARPLQRHHRTCGGGRGGAIWVPGEASSLFRQDRDKPKRDVRTDFWRGLALCGGLPF